MNKIKFILCLIISFNIYAISFTLTHDLSNKQLIRAGEYFKTRIEIYPKNEIPNIPDLIEFLKKGELGPFTIIELDDFEASENNSDVIVANLGLVMTRPSGSPIQFKFNNQTFDLGLRNYGIDGEIKPQLHIFDQSVISDYQKPLIAIVLIILLLLACCFILLLKKKSKKQKIDSRLVKKEKISLIKKALSRNEFEQLYLDRRNWIHYVQKDSVDNFFHTLNQYQYKPELSSEELDEVKQAHSEIKVVDDV